MTIVEIIGVIGVKVTYPQQADNGALERTVTIYTSDGNDCTIVLVTPPDTPELPVDIETPTA